MKTFRVTFDTNVDDDVQLKDIQEDTEQLFLDEFESAQLISIEEIKNAESN